MSESIKKNQETTAVQQYLSLISDWKEKRNDSDGICPYRGLRFFDHKSSLLLTARQSVVNRIRSSFTEDQIAIVIGGSGCGKSSIVRGKLLSELMNGHRPIPGRVGDWQTITCRPLTKPVTEFANAAYQSLVNEYYMEFDESEYRAPEDSDDETIEEYSLAREEALAARQRVVTLYKKNATPKDWLALFSKEISKGRSPEPGTHSGFLEVYGIADQINYAETDDNRPDVSNLMIIIDQFEEIFRPDVDAQERSMFCSMIRYINRIRPNGVYIVISMRAEDMHRCAQIDDFTEIITDSSIYVDFLDEDDLNKAVIEPAQYVFDKFDIYEEHDKEFEDTYPFHPDVVKEIVSETSKLREDLPHKADHLPLFQHGLFQLWKVCTSRWSEEGGESQFLVMPEDLQTLRDACGKHKGSWLRGCLNYSAQICFNQAVDAYDAIYPNPEGRFSADILIEATFKELAAQDENGRYYRTFAEIEGTLSNRFSLDSNSEVFSTVTNALQAAMDVFVNEGLITKVSFEEGAADNFVYDVTHEALIRNWKKFKKWIREEATVGDAIFGSITLENNPPSYDISRPDKETLSNHLEWSGKPKHSSLRWIVEKRIKRKKGFDSTTANQILKGVGVRYFYNNVIRTALFVAVPIVVIIAGVATFYFNQADKNEKLRQIAKSRAESYRSLLVAKNDAEISGMPNLGILHEIKSGQNHYLQNAEVDLESAPPEAAVEHQKTTLLSSLFHYNAFRNTLGNKLQVSLLNKAKLFDNISEGEHTAIYKGDRCKSYSDDFALSSERVTINKDPDGLGLRFYNTSTQEAGKNSLVVFFSDRREKSLPVPDVSYDRVCLSKDGRVLALSHERSRVPTIYLLDDIIQSKYPYSTVAISARELRLDAGAYPEVLRLLRNGSEQKLKLIGIGPPKKLHSVTVRAVYFQNYGEEFVGYFVDGVIEPVATANIQRTKFVKNSRPHWLINPRNRFTGSERFTMDVVREEEEKCKITSKEYPYWKNPQFKKHQNRSGTSEYTVIEKYVPKFGNSSFVIFSSLRSVEGSATASQNDEESDKIYRFWVRMFSPKIGCKPIGFANFFSSPMDRIDIKISGEENSSITLAMRDERHNVRELTIHNHPEKTNPFINELINFYDWHKSFGYPKDNVYSAMRPLLGIK